jgi:pyruvate/2-oxoglutarate dehydrogenase complex dihydrolipoamide dehydrogenase (E3) component/uncharacterized membrane protein YdjX (TVP38/TMEM64 family)
VKPFKLKIFIAIVVALGLALVVHYDLTGYLSLESLKENRHTLQELYLSNKLTFLLSYFAVYVISIALSIPGATVLTLAAGALFGLGMGFFVVSFASTIGATLAFLVSRFLFQDWVQQKFGDRLKSFNEGLKKEGPFYLFSLRLIPIFPFFMINLLMGLTALKTWTFYWVSQLGMLPGTLVYVNAGTQLAQIDSLSEVATPSLLMSFVLIGILPLFSKWLVTFLKSRKYMKNFDKPKTFDYNVLVIGGGSAGLVSAYIAAAVKAKVALIEKNKMGGDCLNTGCIPSKTIIKSAKVLQMIKNSSKYGHEVDQENVKSDFSKVMGRVQQVIKKIEPHDSIERFTGLGVECFTGDAKILSPYKVEVNGEVLTTKNIIVATGAFPFVPPIPGLKEMNPLTSDTLWDINERPKRLLVLGGGPIGSELAQSFARLGSEVIQVEMGPKIMGREDDDVSEHIQKVFEGNGIRILTEHKASRFEIRDGQKLAICEHNGQEVEVEFDEVLVALGRRARTKGFGLEELDVEINPNGTMIVDEYLRSPRYPNIYACGDVAGPYQFTHTAAHQAWFACVNSLFSPMKKFKVDYRVIPWCTFVDPEVARVGVNEKEAKEKGINYEVTTYGLDDLDRAIAEGEDEGFVKVITPKGSDKILGVTIVGSHAGELIAEYILAMKYGIGLNKILGTIHIYPTWSEANKFAAGVWKKAHAPEKALEYLKKFHSWRR